MDDFTRWSTADESQFLERKSAYQRADGQPRQRKTTDVAWDIAETLSAMANADGGELIVGVEDDGTITGVPHPPKKVSLLLDVPRSPNYVRPPLACSVREVRSDDNLLLLHFSVTASPQVHRLTDGRYLLRHKDQNLPFGADEIQALKQTKSQGLIELSYPPGSSLDAIDLDLIESLRHKLGFLGTPEQFLTDNYFVEERGGELAPNLAALLLFAKQPTRWHARCGINFVRWSGTERKFGAELNVEKRLQVDGPLATIIERAYEMIKPFIRERQQLQNLLFTERLEYPTYVWQEGIVNAVTHRDYSIQGTQIEIWMFDDRMEIRSPGLPPLPVTLEALNSGQAVHVSRNPRIAKVLAELGFVRELGEGVPRMIAEMERQGFYPPRFEAVSGTFQVALRNQPVYDADTLQWLTQFETFALTGDQKRVLAYAYRNENRFTSRAYQQLVGLDIYGASNSIRDLVRKHLVRPTRRGSRVYELVQAGDASEQGLPQDLARILESVEYARAISNEDVQRVLGVSRPTATRYLREWSSLGHLIPSGKGAGRHYDLPS
jgi:ATP-dependent DNA helicase RecG